MRKDNIHVFDMGEGDNENDKVLEEKMISIAIVI